MSPRPVTLDFDGPPVDQRSAEMRAQLQRHFTDLQSLLPDDPFHPTAREQIAEAIANLMLMAYLLGEREGVRTEVADRRATADELMRRLDRLDPPKED